MRLEERKELKRFLQKRVSKSVSDYIYRYEAQLRMMNLPELGSVEEVVAKIFDWIRHDFVIALLNSDVVSAELTGEVAFPKQVRLNMAPRGFVIA